MRIGSAGVKMAKQAAKWRESSSLVIISHFNDPMTVMDLDYKVLLYNRSERASFMPTASVFPGGVRETADESLLWAKHLKNFGVKEDELKKLVLTRSPAMKPQPKIFQTEDGPRLHRDISLRITAIRETFEEMGIMICRDRNSFSESKKFGHFREDFDRKHWQHAVHENPEEFLNLCKELDVIPDLWSLNEWSVWLTPATVKKRFETAFYLVTLEKAPNVMIEESEGTGFKWLTPKEALLLNLKGEIWLPPPQHNELSRLLNFKELLELQKFASARASNGTILMLPVQRKCSDGMVGLYPGDSNYPEDPFSDTELKNVEMSMFEFRSAAKKLHRAEFVSLGECVQYQNFDTADGHKKPLNIKPLSNL